MRQERATPPHTHVPLARPRPPGHRLLARAPSDHGLEERLEERLERSCHQPSTLSPKGGSSPDPTGVGLWLRCLGLALGHQ